MDLAVIAAVEGLLAFALAAFLAYHAPRDPAARVLFAALALFAGDITLEASHSLFHVPRTWQVEP